MHRLIEAKRPEIAALCRRFRGQGLDVFGLAGAVRLDTAVAADLREPVFGESADG